MRQAGLLKHAARFGSNDLLKHAAESGKNVNADVGNFVNDDPRKLTDVVVSDEGEGWIGVGVDEEDGTGEVTEVEERSGG